MSQATKVAINGAAGRMGRELVIACQRNDALVLAAAGFAAAAFPLPLPLLCLSAWTQPRQAPSVQAQTQVFPSMA